MYNMGVAGVVGQLMERQNQMINQNIRRSRRHSKHVEEGDSELRLYVATLISILISKKIISPEEFEEISKIIDGMDGQVDAKFEGTIDSKGHPEPMQGGAEGHALDQLARAVKSM